ncbi:uncharacterized protein LOC134562999 isoform X1 [Prinia subflava]|uniref:uncharacterized protein LOC134562999 isoform X1 n=1 Tax=Prinia subflava TaxID=208062 RepID=UPI002FE206C6
MARFSLTGGENSSEGSVAPRFYIPPTRISNTKGCGDPAQTPLQTPPAASSQVSRSGAPRAPQGSSTAMTCLPLSAQHILILAQEQQQRVRRPQQELRSSGPAPTSNSSEHQHKPPSPSHCPGGRWTPPEPPNSHRKSSSRPKRNNKGCGEHPTGASAPGDTCSRSELGTDTDNAAAPARGGDGDELIPSPQ